MADNGISTLPVKADRVTAKMAIAQTERQTAVVTVADGGVTWTHQIVVPTAAYLSWKASTAYLINTYIFVNGYFYKCTVPGTTGVAAPVWLHDFKHRDHNVYNAALVSPAAHRPWN